jgi:hypothetical protein
MYTKLDDLRHAKKIMTYIKMNPDATRKLIRKDCITNHHRLKYLEQAGHITLPPPTPVGMRNREYNERRSRYS